MLKKKLRFRKLLIISAIVFLMGDLYADEKKMRIAVLDFKNTIVDEEWDMMEWMIPEYLAKCLSDCEEFSVIDRNDIENCLMGVELSHERITDQDTGLKAGIVLRADIVVMGSYKRVDNRAVIAIYLLNIKNESPICGLYIFEKDGEDLERMVSRMYSQILKIVDLQDNKADQNEDNIRESKKSSEKSTVLRVGIRTGVFPGSQVNNIKGGEIYLDLVDKSGFGLQLNIGGYKRKISNTDNDSYLLPLFFTYQPNIKFNIKPYFGTGLYFYKYSFEMPDSDMISTEQRLELALNIGVNIMSSRYFFINIDGRLYVNDNNMIKKQVKMPLAVGYGLNFNW